MISGVFARFVVLTDLHLQEISERTMTGELRDKMQKGAPMNPTGGHSIDAVMQVYVRDFYYCPAFHVCANNSHAYRLS
jgi:hypothetical protein